MMFCSLGESLTTFVTSKHCVKGTLCNNFTFKQLQNHFGGALPATARMVRLVLHCVTLVVMARHVMAPTTQQQLDPSASYKRKLAQYSLYRHHGRGDEETELLSVSCILSGHSDSLSYLLQL